MQSTRLLGSPHDLRRLVILIRTVHGHSRSVLIPIRTHALNVC